MTNKYLEKIARLAPNLKRVAGALAGKLAGNSKVTVPKLSAEAAKMKDVGAVHARAEQLKKPLSVAANHEMVSGMGPKTSGVFGSKELADKARKIHSRAQASQESIPGQLRAEQVAVRAARMAKSRAARAV